MRIYKPRWKRNGVEHVNRTWWVQYSLNRKVIRHTLKTRDKRVAYLRASKIVEREERKLLGIADKFEEHLERPLSEHVDAFLGHLKSRDVSEGHIADRKRSLDDFLGDTQATTVLTIDLVETQHWLGMLKERLSARSVNKRFQALRQFGLWLVKARRCGYNPFAGLTTYNEETDRRRVRRALTDAEVAHLLDCTRRRPLERARIKRSRTGVTATQEAKLRRLGHARAFLYEFALGTGLRRGELKGLTWADLDLDGATLTVRASVAKSKKRDTLPLRSDLMPALAAHQARLATGGFWTEPGDVVFPGRLFPVHGTFKADLVYAGLNGEDDQGRIVDFHSFRVTFITRLSVAKVHPRTAQALARHSKIELTMKTYTDVRLLDLRGAVEEASGAPCRCGRGNQRGREHGMRESETPTG